MLYGKKTIVFNHPINHKNGTGEQSTIIDVFKRIKTPSNIIDDLRREFLLNGKSKDYDQQKLTLPSWLPSIEEGGKKKAEIKALNGFLYFDIDFYDKNQNNIAESIGLAEIAKGKLSSNPFICGLWFSVSKSGLGFLFKIPALQKEDYLFFWQKIEKYILQEYNYVVDPSTKNINRLNFISSDPQIVLNEEAKPFTSEEISGGSKGRIIERNKVTPFDPLKFKLVSTKTLAKIYNRSFIDLHFPEYIKKADIDLGHGTLLFKEKVPTIRCYFPKNKLIGNNRNSHLSTYFTNLVWLNWSIKSSDELKMMLYGANKHRCGVPLSNDEIESIYNKVMNRLEECSLEPIPTYSHIHFTSICKLDLKDKQEICGSVPYLLNHHEMKIQIDELLKSDLVINKEVIANKMKLSVSTIKRHWKEWKIQIENHNKNLKTKKHTNMKIEKNIENLRPEEIESMKMIITSSKEEIKKVQEKYKGKVIALKFDFNLFNDESLWLPVKNKKKAG